MSHSGLWPWVRLTGLVIDPFVRRSQERSDLLGKNLRPRWVYGHKNGVARPIGACFEVRLRSISVTESSVGRVYFPPAIGHKLGVREGRLIGGTPSWGCWSSIRDFRLSLCDLRA
jgi:hypothetical protein